MELITWFLIVTQVFPLHYVRSISPNGFRNAKTTKDFLQHDDGQNINHAGITKLGEKVHISVGEGDLTTACVLAPDGLILVDATENSLVSITNIYPDVPVRAIIYTHSEAYNERPTPLLHEAPVGVWLSARMQHVSRLPTLLAAPIRYKRALKSGELASNTAKFHYHSGEQPLPEKTGKDRQHRELATTEVTEKQRTVIIAGLEVTLIQTTGPDNQLGVWIPAIKTFFCGKLFKKAYPSLYSLRGMESQDPMVWVQSLDVVRNLKPESLVPSYTDPIQGRENIMQIITSYRDSLQFVHDQTLRYMHFDRHPVNGRQMLELPPGLKKNPYLGEHYTTHDWASAMVFGKYLGWYSGAVEELSLHPPREEGMRWIQLAGGVAKLLTKAQHALQEGEAQWALELATSVLHLHEDHSIALDIRAQALKDLADQHSSVLAKNYYLNSIKEDVSVPKPRNFALFLPLEQLLRFMSTWIKPQVCDKLNLQFVLIFTDVNKTFELHLRNAIIELKDLQCSVRSPKIAINHGSMCGISLRSTLWREVLGQIQPSSTLLTDGDVRITGNRRNIRELFSCLELVSPDFDYAGV